MVKNSIVKRWIVTVLSSIIIIIIAFAVVLCVILRLHYYNAARLTLESRSSDVVLSYFNQTSLSSEDQFIKTARTFVENYADKSVMEVWIIDTNGEVIVSSTGFSVKNEKYPDYNYAKADGKFGEWIGKNSNNEKIIAQTYMLPQSDVISSAAVRYIVSLQDIDRQLTFIYIIVALVALFIILLVITSGAFFIRSIINPVKKINETADRIANGDFDVSIEKYKYNDEIGQLCETINHMAHEINESEQLKNEFISTVSHELRTPLTAIKGWGETIRSSDGDKEIIEKGINVIVNESERLTELVEELLDFSRMENGKMSLKISRID
ncbi:MAG: HAMP domain-containing histidine kinase, partial [Oscillospiraceae bacterium]|nr:HAMP domain-containing histidine kinase [Oscillospiraceae bacterium]